MSPPDADRGSRPEHAETGHAEAVHAETGTPAGAPEERALRLTRSELNSLRRSIAEALGPEGAQETLFRVGRHWGEEAVRRDGSGSARTRMERALRGMAAAGLGSATLHAFHVDPSGRGCRVTGRVLDPLELGRKLETGVSPEGSACTLTTGYLTGVARAVTGIDVVCSPIRCDARCEGGGCGFEIRAAHDRPKAEAAPRPAGNARFFLGSLGSILGENDISLDDLIEHTADAIVLIDTANIVRFWSRGAERMFLFRREEVVGRKIGFIVPEDLLASDELGRIDRKLQERGVLSEIITRRVRKDGLELHVGLTRTLLHDSSGRAIGSVAILRDVTERKRAEEQLHQSRSLALIGELAAKIAHEVKNPLAGIYAAVQLIGRDLAEEDPRKEVLVNVGQEVRRLDETVQELLQFARPVPPKPWLVELATFVREVAASLELQPQIARHAIEIDIEPGLMCSLDSRLMGQVFTNLILNAAQAMEEPGRIRVRARRSGDSAAIEVSDEGPGIPRDVAQRLFEPFFTTKSHGSGLGLSIARKNVQAHGGTIAARDRDGGATFLITLPLSDEEADLS